ncbi:sigma-54 interaction domain-containing protein [Tautonia sociabilis]|uniref:Sigma-54-dependent Fis family transcriptional regulator n=1 Tax=Tautonia sociabilis TaxID=2080755 RepID=A0A432ME43_9BACT|nr:sigma-54 dependent transcriptional regulator [Tautonia sociabilis]RUL83412.1 sigma-54-dependent Fis family transcriptional regulator [Tautonia sociabilis]
MAMPYPRSGSAAPPIPGPADSDAGLPGVIGDGPVMREVARVTRQVARSRACVLIVGETGAGKELIARAVHDLSPRASGPYIRVNCGALTESLLESELFGHVKGSFTGAVENRTGRFEAAHTGTIFLDEINSTSPKLQVKLLRVLQEGEFERVGDVSTRKVDVRVVAATNRDLREEIDAGRFREDLYYRLNVVPIDLPPLRDRRDDIPALVNFFLARYSEQNQREMRRVDPEAMKLLCRYDWPGNVRELQNYIERAVVLGDGPELRPEHLPPQLRGEAPPRPIRGKAADLDTMTAELVRRGLLAAGPNADELIRRIVSPVERELIQQVLAACDRVQIKAAARLGINRNTLHKKLSEYGLDSSSHGESGAGPSPDEDA